MISIPPLIFLSPSAFAGSLRAAIIRPSFAFSALPSTKESGLTDRPIALDYASQRSTVLTPDRKMTALPGCRRH